MKGDKELIGTLRGFDVYVNMVLEDVEEIEVTPEGKKVTKVGGQTVVCHNSSCTTRTQQSYIHTALSLQADQILLNGNNIAVLVPGGKPEN